MSVQAHDDDDVSTGGGALRRQRRLLLRLRGRLSEDLAEIDRHLVDLDRQIARIDADPAFEDRRPEHPADQSVQLPPQRRPLRAMVIDALEDLAWPATSRDLVGYLDARFGRRVSSTRFGTLGSDELSAYERSGASRPVWLSFGLDLSTGKAIKHLWARSDWPLKARLVAPSTPRLQHLKITARLCDLAQRPSSGTAHPQRLLLLAEAYARDLPNAMPARGAVNTAHTAEWREIAQGLIDELEPRDDEIRTHAAWQLRSHPERQLLYGPIEEMTLLQSPDIDASTTSSLPAFDLRANEEPRRRRLAQLLPRLIAELAGTGAAHLSNIYVAVEERFPELTDDELDSDGNLQWKHDLRWELETLVGQGAVRRRRDLGRGLYSAA